MVAAALGPKAVGPLTGSVPPSARQAMVDEFTARTEPWVLVSQIQAGGVGLNIQAASVVIIAEPQWTPAMEEQAIARCHRMGQVRRLDVHRLLTEDSVDQRMLEVLRVKADEFNEYARRSDLKDITPDAVDISDLTAAAEVASQAESERRIVEMERKRLRMEEGREGRPVTARLVAPLRAASADLLSLFRTSAASSDCERLAHAGRAIGSAFAAPRAQHE